ncbi:response regulator [Syntrophomonas curvata]
MIKKKRVILVNEHKILGDLLRASLVTDSELAVAGEYGSGKEALNGAVSLQPDLIITGIDLPDIDGVVFTKKIMEVLPDTKIIAVTHYPEKDCLLAFLAAGGRGYLNKYISDQDLLSTVKIVLNGDIALSQEGFQMAAKEYRRIAMVNVNSEQDGNVGQRLLPEIRTGLLSDREKQVLQLYAHGYSSKEMCKILFLSTNTVETYKKRIKEKLRLSSKADILQYAIRHGLLEDWEK